MPERDGAESEPGPAEGQTERPGKDDGFPGPSRTEDARVTDVTDGDTIELSHVGKTRLIGVDTPEVFGGAECYGREASAFTKRLLAPGTRVEYRLGEEPRDRYGRALAYVWLPDGRLANGVLVARGYAVPLTIPPNDDLAGRFRTAARRARRRSRGLWDADTCGGDADLPAGGGGEPDTPPPSDAGDRDCSDFSTQAEAQDYFDGQGGGPGRNVDRLDADGDGRVCESLP